MIFPRAIILCTYTILRTIFVRAVNPEDKKWTAFQYEGLDDLYIQTLNADPIEPNYAILKSLCSKWKSDGVFNTVVKRGNDEFRSRFQGRPVKLEDVPPNVHENGSRRYEWTVGEHKLVTDIYACAVELRYTHHTYAVSKGYEHDHLFFLFTFDRYSKILELKAFIMEDLVQLIGDNLSSYMNRREKYYKNVIKKHREDFSENPICGLTKVDKLRLCALVLNTNYYKTRFEFIASAANVNFRCEEVIVDDGKSRVKHLREDTYSCLAKTVSEPKTDVSVHISRNYLNYKVNTFTAVADENGIKVVKLDTGFKYVFFVEEPYNEKWEMKPRVRRHNLVDESDSAPSSSGIDDGNKNNS